LDLTSAGGIATYRAFVKEAAELCVSYGGSISGEHGDGQSRAELLPTMFGSDLVRAFAEFKALWDPDNKMNPGKVVAPARIDDHLRLGPHYRPAVSKTFFSFAADQGSFAQASLRCVGVGKGRKDGTGTMCPSYMATREEKDSTRGRARLLFEMLQGDVITDGWRSEAVRDALDLCLSCRGCKNECPVNVDIATYKAEFLAHHYQRRLRPAAHYSMGWLPLLARAASRTPRLVNAATHAPGVAMAAKWAGGIAYERDVPPFATQTFTDWFRSRLARVAGDGDRPLPRSPRSVLLWPDTFTNYFHPHVGRAAVRVLEAAGFRVEIPDRTLCCGLTWISTGQLAMAKRVLRRTVDVLAPALEAGMPLVGLEPSCTAVFRSDLRDLLPADEGAKRLARQTMTLSELLAQRAPGWEPPQRGQRAIVQSHCHQTAVLGIAPDTDLLAKAGLDAEVLDSGCCGLAGNFGFERGHYDVSMACAERVLLPAVRQAAAETLIIADGFSCRTQIEQATNRSALHLAEVLAPDPLRD
jgi:Fe-S oxidoreductase